MEHQIKMALNRFPAWQIYILPGRRTICQALTIYVNFSAPPGNRTRVTRMGILHDTTTPAALVTNSTSNFKLLLSNQNSLQNSALRVLDLAKYPDVINNEIIIPLQVKIGDFGLTRDIYASNYYRSDLRGMLPVRWMAPESIVDGLSTTQSDVWAFGVLLWEIVTMGQTPFQSKTNHEVLAFVPSGGHLEVPPQCPDRLRGLMLGCWSYNPEERPTFAECREHIGELLVYQEELSDIPTFYARIQNGTTATTTNGDSKDSWKTTTESARSQATTIPIGGAAPSSSSTTTRLRSTSSAASPASYLQLLREEQQRRRSAAASTESSAVNSSSDPIARARARGSSDASSVLSNSMSAYEMPAPLQRARCLCASVKYQNLMTNHVCPVGRDPMPLPPSPLAVTNEGYAATSDAFSPSENMNVADSSDGSSDA